MDGSEPDINRFDVKPSNSSSTASTSDAITSRPSGTNEGKKPPKFDPSALYYDMTGDKFMVIFNHFKYEKTRYFNNKRPASRKGTHQDVLTLKSVFGKLGFKVLTYTDYKHEQIMDEIIQIANQDHTLTSCLVVVILTHGDKDGVVYAADRGYYLRDVLSVLETGHIGLVNKPKLFFVQACRGGKLDEGRTVRLDGSDDEMLVVPSHVDFLLMQSSVDEHLSWRDVDGSWMIQELCQVIDEHRNSLDLLQLVTIANRNVAYKRASNTPSDKKTHNKKQTPETRFTLTKLVKF